ncbi:MAG: hypothetical protein MZV65_48155 [Chromatiales bacterium]|nr:hypothetical protein [Chromatiales bacterium]
MGDFVAVADQRLADQNAVDPLSGRRGRRRDDGAAVAQAAALLPPVSPSCRRRAKESRSSMPM